MIFIILSAPPPGANLFCAEHLLYHILTHHSYYILYMKAVHIATGQSHQMWVRYSCLRLLC